MTPSVSSSKNRPLAPPAVAARLGWQRTWYPRCALSARIRRSSILTVTAEERMGLLPKDHIAGQAIEVASDGSAIRERRLPGDDCEPQGDEPIVLGRLTADELLSSRRLATGRVGLDIGQMKQLEPKLHTVSIRPEDHEVDMIWRAALTYPGYSWASKNLTRLHAEVQ